MADGSDKPVEKIKAGDLVMNPMTGKGQKVYSTRAGYEGKPLLRIGFAGNGEEGAVIAVTEL